MRSALVLCIVAALACLAAADTILDQNNNQYASLQEVFDKPELCGSELRLDGIFAMPPTDKFACDTLSMRSYNVDHRAVVIGGDWKLRVNRLEVRDLIIDGLYRDGLQLTEGEFAEAIVIDNCEINRFVGPWYAEAGQNATIQVTNCVFSEQQKQPCTAEQLHEKLTLAVLTAYELRQGVADMLDGLTNGRFGRKYPEPIAAVFPELLVLAEASPMALPQIPEFVK